MQKRATVEAINANQLVTPTDRLLFSSGSRPQIENHQLSSVRRPHIEDSLCIPVGPFPRDTVRDTIPDLSADAVELESSTVVGVRGRRRFFASGTAVGDATRTPPRASETAVTIPAIYLRDAGVYDAQDDIDTDELATAAFAQCREEPFAFHGVRVAPNPRATRVGYRSAPPAQAATISTSRPSARTLPAPVRRFSSRIASGTAPLDLSASPLARVAASPVAHAVAPSPEQAAVSRVAPPFSPAIASLPVPSLGQPHFAVGPWLDAPHQVSDRSGSENVCSVPEGAVQSVGYGTNVSDSCSVPSRARPNDSVLSSHLPTGDSALSMYAPTANSSGPRYAPSTHASRYETTEIVNPSKSVVPPTPPSRWPVGSSWQLERAKRLEPYERTYVVRERPQVVRTDVPSLVRVRRRTRRPLDRQQLAIYVLSTAVVAAIAAILMLI